jgi:hypothetical protein
MISFLLSFYHNGFTSPLFLEYSKPVSEKKPGETAIWRCIGYEEKLAETPDPKVKNL